MVSRRFSIEQCRTNPTTCFVYGSNNLHEGMGGQAIIRGQRNSVGFSTKKAPGSRDEDYFSDDEYEDNCKIIDSEIEKIKIFADEMDAKQIAFPLAGIGTGLSQMQSRCPLTFLYLCKRLILEFKFNNVESLIPK